MCAYGTCALYYSNGTYIHTVEEFPDAFVGYTIPDSDYDSVLNIDDRCWNSTIDWTATPDLDFDGDGCRDADEDMDDDDDGVPDVLDACNFLPGTSVRIVQGVLTPTATDGVIRTLHGRCILRALQMHSRTMPRNGGTWMAMDTGTTTPMMCSP